MTKNAHFDVVVAGAGPAGLATGLAIAHFGLRCAVVGPKADSKDGRTAALFQGSVAFLQRIGAWAAIAPSATAIEAIRLVDATGSLFRAPEVLFRAREIGEDSFGFNVKNSDLTAALEGLAHHKLTRIETAAVKAIEPGRNEIRITTADGQDLTAALLAGADGRNSLATRRLASQHSPGPIPNQLLFARLSTAGRIMASRRNSTAALGHSPRFLCRATPQAWSGSNNLPKPSA